MLELGQQNTMSSVDVPQIQINISTSPGNQRDRINANKQQLTS